MMKFNWNYLQLSRLLIIIIVVVAVANNCLTLVGIYIHEHMKKNWFTDSIFSCLWPFKTFLEYNWIYLHLCVCVWDRERERRKVCEQHQEEQETSFINFI